MRQLATTAAVLALAACGDDAKPTAQGPTYIVDQAYEPGINNAVAGVGGVGAYGQTFTVGTAGRLSLVDLFLSNQGGDDTIRVDIRTTTGGFPSLNDSTVLGSRVLAASRLPTSPNKSFVTIDFSSDDITVAVGQVLAIVMIRTAGSGSSDVLVYAEAGTAEDYAGGTGCQRIGGSGTGWTAHNGDFYFRTRVVP